MCEFANNFVEKLIGRIPDEYLRIVRDELSVFSSEYDISPRETNVVPYSNPVPQELTKYLASIKITGGSDRTVENYGLQLTIMFRELRKKISEITGDDILLHLAKMKSEKNLKDSTIEHYRIIINTFFEWCVTNDYIDKNPCRKIKAIKSHSKKEMPLTDFQIEAVRSACTDIRDVALIDFLLSTGCRISETLNIRISDIDFKEMKLIVLGKGNKYRTVYINGRAAHSLNEYMESRKDLQMTDYLFVSKKRPYGKLTKDAIELLFRKLGEKAGVANLHPHLLRKTMSTSALRRGMDITVVQKILGHSNIETTMRYVTVSDEDVENAHRRFVS